MKLLRYGPAGAERPGMLHSDGTVRDLSEFIEDIAPPFLNRASLTRLRNIDPLELAVAPSDTRLGACVAGTRNFLAIGLNYADHAAESGAPVPSEPILFNKAPSCIGGPDDDVVIPRNATKLDWEVELAVVIGETALYVPEDRAAEVIAGYCVCNDLSERSFQLERGGQWTKGKGCPTFGPLGPWLVTTDEIPDPQALSLWLDVNGVRMQTGSTRTMIFPVLRIVSYVSHFMRLEPGDVITTGTPPGVGLGRQPPKYLSSGDVIELGIDGLGKQKQRVRTAVNTLRA